MNAPRCSRIRIAPYLSRLFPRKSESQVSQNKYQTFVVDIAIKRQYRDIDGSVWSEIVKISTISLQIVISRFVSCVNIALSTQRLRHARESSSTTTESTETISRQQETWRHCAAPNVKRLELVKSARSYTHITRVSCTSRRIARRPPAVRQNREWTRWARAALCDSMCGVLWRKGNSPTWDSIYIRGISSHAYDDNYYSTVSPVSVRYVGLFFSLLCASSQLLSHSLSLFYLRLRRFAVLYQIMRYRAIYNHDPTSKLLSRHTCQTIEYVGAGSDFGCVPPVVVILPAKGNDF